MSTDSTAQESFPAGTTLTDKLNGDAQANKWGRTAGSAAADLQWRIRDSADRVQKYEKTFYKPVLIIHKDLSSARCSRTVQRNRECASETAEI